MLLHGSCCCQSVKFSVESPHPYPFLQCYCSICRKTGGSGGFGINLGAVNESLQVEGRQHLRYFSAMYNNHETGAPEQSPAQRHFCGLCGSPLWVWDPRWPELLHPYASAIDTELPTPPERYHIFLNSKANWVNVPEGETEKHCATFEAGLSLAGWHEKHGLNS